MRRLIIATTLAAALAPLAALDASAASGIVMPRTHTLRCIVYKNEGQIIVTNVKDGLFIPKGTRVTITVRTARPANPLKAKTPAEVIIVVEAPFDSSLNMQGAGKTRAPSGATSCVATVRLLPQARELYRRS